MKKKDFAWGLLWGAIPLILLVLAIFAAFLWSPTDRIDFVLLLKSTPLAAAFCGGTVVGARLRRRGLIGGATEAFLIWLIVAILVCWLAPGMAGRWLSTLLWPMLAAGIVGGLCGVNLPRKVETKE